MTDRWVTGLRRAWRSLVILAGLLVVLGALVSIPVMRDMETRREVTEVYAFGRELLRELAVDHAGRGGWPADPLSVLPEDRARWPGRVTVVDRLGRKGFRLHADDPAVLKEHPLEMELQAVDGRLLGSCRVPGVKATLLPAPCRPDAEPFVVEASGGGA